VEAVFAGPKSAVDTMLTLAKRGPSAARVEKVEAKPYQEEVQKGFEVRRGKH
jgi:acylphosphatase